MGAESTRAGTSSPRVWELREYPGNWDTVGTQAEPAQFTEGWWERHAANKEQLSRMLGALRDIIGRKDREWLKVTQPGRVGDPGWGDDM